MARVEVTGVPGPTGESIRAALAARATLDVVVIGTGEQPVKPFLELEAADWDGMIAGLRRAFSDLRAAVARDDRRIVLVSSVPAIRPVQGAALAGIAGAFQHTLAQVAAVELGGAGTTVNAVAPGFVDDERFSAATPLGRSPSPADVAEAVVFLASEQAGSISGAILPVDGGLTLTKSDGGSPLLRG